jgi:cytochrome c-type biogenesis protein CcmH/NrfG
MHRRIRLARGDPVGSKGPSSLLPDEPGRRRPRRSERPLTQGPSSLLPEEFERRHTRTHETPLQQGPSSLLPETPDKRPSSGSNPAVVPVSPSSLLPAETERRSSRLDEPLPAQGPESLLPALPQREARASGPELVAVSPTSLLPADAGRSGHRSEAPLPEHAPSILLPEPAAAEPSGPELVAVSPSELLPSAEGSERRWDIRRVAGIGAAVILPLLVGTAVLLSSNRFPAPARPPITDAVRVQAKAQAADAIAALREQVASQPDNAELRHKLGKAMVADGDYKLAESEYRHALSLGGDPRQLVTALARALLLQGEFEKLLREAKLPESAAHVVPDFDTVRAFAHLGLGQLQEAEALFDAVLELDPRNGEALLGKARIAAARNQPAEAQRLGALVSKYADQGRDALLERAQLIWVLDKAAEARAAGQG